MKYIQSITIACLLQQSLFSQGVGIGTPTPGKAVFEVRQATANALSNGVFGSGYAGISIQQNPATIGFNQYLDWSNGNLSRWMSSGYGMRQILETGTGNMVWKALRNGVAENVSVAADEKVAIQYSYNAVNSNGGFGVNRSPLTALHVLYKDPLFPGSGAGFNPYGIVGFESNIDAFINVMSPMNFENGILFGSPLSSTRGGVLYRHASDINQEVLTLRTGGNLNRVVIGATGNVAIGDFTATNKLEVDGALALIGQSVDYEAVTTDISNNLDRLNIGNRSYIRINNSNADDFARIGTITPGTRMGQLLIVECGSGGTLQFFGYQSPIAGNIMMPGYPGNIINENGSVTFIWNGTYWKYLSQVTF